MAADDRPDALSSTLAELERQVGTITRPTGEGSVSEFFLGRRFGAERRRRLAAVVADDSSPLERKGARRDSRAERT